MKIRLLENCLSLIVIVSVTLGEDECPAQCMCNPEKFRLSCDDVKLDLNKVTFPKYTKILAIIGKSNNRFTEIPRLRNLHFRNLPDLTELFVIFANVESIDEDAFKDLKQLKRLELKFNKIQTIYQGTFEGLDNLELLSLNGNEYCRLQTGAVSNLKSLRDLYLSDMRLRSLHVNSFQGLDNLRHLDLSGNNLRRFDKDILEPVKTLTSLDITGNRFQGLDASMLATLQKLESVNLGNNPWQCNCDMKWFKKLPMKFIYDSKAFSADRVVVCNGPAKHQYVNLKDVPDDELACIKPSVKDCQNVLEMVGTEVSIVCDIIGDPFPDIVWTLPDKTSLQSIKDLNETKFEYLDNGTLVIKSAEIPQSGVWDISVENSLGSDKTTVKVEIVKAGFPPTVKNCQSVSGKVGNEATIECEIKGFPYPDIFWMPPGLQSINSTETVDPLKYEIKPEGKLVIKKLEMPMNGKWEIAALNKNGRADASVDVKVMLKGFAPSIKDCLDVKEAEEGRQIKIECTITGDPFPNITWILPDDTKVHSSDPSTKEFRILKSGILLVRSVDKNYDGSWEVDVKNAFGNAEEFLNVEVQTSAAPPATNWILIGAASGGGVALLSLIIITIVCCKNKKTKVGDSG